MAELEVGRRDNELCKTLWTLRGGRSAEDGVARVVKSCLRVKTRGAGRAGVNLQVGIKRPKSNGPSPNTRAAVKGQYLVIEISMQSSCPSKLGK